MLSYYTLNEIKRKAVIDVEKQKKNWNGFESVKPSLEWKVVMSIAVRAHNILMHSRIKQSLDPYKTSVWWDNDQLLVASRFVFAFCF